MLAGAIYAAVYNSLSAAAGLLAADVAAGWRPPAGLVRLHVEVRPSICRAFAFAGCLAGRSRGFLFVLRFLQVRYPSVCRAVTSFWVSFGPILIRVWGFANIAESVASRYNASCGEQGLHV